jgi:ATP-dependent Zn protease
MSTRRVTAFQDRVTAHHEAGHACTAVELKLKFTKVDIIPSEEDNYAGRIYWLNEIWDQLRANHTDPRVIKLVERRIVTILAGGAAQRRYAPRSNWRRGSRTDHMAVDIWLQRLVGGPPDANDPYQRDEHIEPFPDDTDWYATHRLLDNKTLKAFHAEYGARATALVEQLWPKIQIVAAALLERKTLSYAKVCKLMTEARRIPRNKGTRK